MTDFIPFPGGLQTTSPTTPVNTTGMQVGQDVKVSMEATASPSGVTKTDTDTVDLFPSGTATYLGIVTVSGPRTGPINTAAGPFTAAYSGTADPNDVSYAWTITPTTLFSPSGNSITLTSAAADTTYDIECTLTDVNSSDTGKSASTTFSTTTPSTDVLTIEAEINTGLISTLAGTGRRECSLATVEYDGDAAAIAEFQSYLTTDLDIDLFFDSTANPDEHHVRLFNVNTTDFLAAHPTTTITWDIPSYSGTIPFPITSTSLTSGFWLTGLNDAGLAGANATAYDQSAIPTGSIVRITIDMSP